MNAPQTICLYGSSATEHENKLGTFRWSGIFCPELVVALLIPLVCVLSVIRHIPGA